MEKEMPQAIYFDTNSLRSIGYKMDKPWVAELKAICSQFNIDLITADLVMLEWTLHVYKDVVQNAYFKLKSSIETLNDFGISTSNIKIESPPEMHFFKAYLMGKIASAGIQVIPDSYPSIQSLIGDAMEKRAPFKEDGKGLCDAIIVGTFIEHASRYGEGAIIFFATKDKAIRDSVKRFIENKIQVVFVDESDAVGLLKSSLDAVIEQLIMQRETLLRDFVMMNEKAVLDFVSSYPVVFTDLWLNGYLEEDRIEGTIQKVFSAKPVKITEVVGGNTIYKIFSKRMQHEIKIYVEMELEVELSVNNYGGIFRKLATTPPAAIDSSAPLCIPQPSISDYLNTANVVKTICRKKTVTARVENKEMEVEFENLVLDGVA